MKKRLIPSIALAVALLIVPLQSLSTPITKTPMGALLTAGRFTIKLCGHACADPPQASIELTGAWVVGGKPYIGQITGIAPAHYSADFGRIDVDPFTLQGISPLQQLITLECASITFDVTTKFRVSCFAHLLNGPSQSRTIVVRSTGSRKGGCSCDERNIQGLYIGVA